MSALPWRLLWRTSPEALLGLSMLGVAGTLAERSQWALAGASMAVAALVAAGALHAKVRAGTLRLAWRAPRVDALGLPPPGSELGWRTVAAAEEVLTALANDARSYQDFLPHAPGDVRLALTRATRVHASREEVEEVLRQLESIGQCLASVRMPRAEAPAGKALEGLALRAEALAAAVSELAPAPKLNGLPREERS